SSGEYLPGSLQGKISSDGCLKKEQMVVSAIASTPHSTENAPSSQVRVQVLVKKSPLHSRQLAHLWWSVILTPTQLTML
ncbi:hypothetical protein, partial [Shigella sonnei]|uniref:hypothetical protein n=1 Tax=Shigella sonnei TaxID=624 RepID=UPI002094A94F